ncbi:MAG TPA: hypothetical protein VN633_12950 [Bryobacteraceae bacterium]|nr:hypothetical protein [Bryobacteraceae bacterium]
MIKFVLVFLLAFSGIAWADETEDKRDVYDVLGEILKPSAGTTLEEDVTSRIKRYMAALLYPVELSSFVRPEKDPKFRQLVVALQNQMEEKATGILTYGQFNRLHDAAHSIDEREVTLGPGILVYRSDDGNVVGARGTGAMNDLANPINITRLLCDKSEGACEVSGAEFDLKSGMLISQPPAIYEIKTWGRSRVTAIREHPCGTASLTVDVETKDVTIASVPHADLPFCSKEPANIWKLVDGFPVAWNIYREKYNKARALVYEPARKFFQERVAAH